MNVTGVPRLLSSTRVTVADTTCRLSGDPKGELVAVSPLSINNLLNKNKLNFFTICSISKISGKLKSMFSQNKMYFKYSCRSKVSFGLCLPVFVCGKLHSL